MSQVTGQTPIGLRDLTSLMAKDSKLHMNLEQAFLMITEDKIQLVLMAHIESIESRREWIAPVTLAISLALTFVTTQFNDFVLKAATWQAVFVVVFLLSMGWSAWAIVRGWKATKVPDLIGEMKKAGKTFLWDGS